MLFGHLGRANIKADISIVLPSYNKTLHKKAAQVTDKYNALRIRHHLALLLKRS